MSEFNLANAVGVHATYTGFAQSIWGLYTAGSFTAAGFGASMGEDFTVATAIILAIGYCAFTLAHLLIALNNADIRIEIADEILARLQSSPERLTDHPGTVAAAVRVASGRRLTYALHAVVDPCVVAIILSQGL